MCLGGRMSGTAKQIGIVLFPDVEELDVMGPWEVLCYWTRSQPEDGYEISCLSRSGDLARCAKGLSVQAQHSFADAPPLDALLHPGGNGTRPQLRDDNHLDWVRRHSESTSLMTSVYRLARLRRRWTTHGSSCHHALGDPTIDVRRDARFVDDGDVITSAGVSAGIDMALHLVARFAGTHRAREVKRAIQYDPAPPI